MSEVLSGSPCSKKSVTSALLTTSAFRISPLPQSNGILPSGGVSRFAIVSNVSKLYCVAILPNTVYCPSRKFESL